MILERCVSTVLTVIPNRAAISWFDFPSAKWRMISYSRGVDLVLDWLSRFIPDLARL